ncbi:uncharacterized protein BYT42DRAFT_32782 [Radiomyces spectabilis]|uniref:uncharacterized protein n=1 Tax=Radiomyces spectabilis TaxID=64574 RepID=UPI00221E5E99|nr:uncharacterized protein BYT42DRAFT_32782 [Radiomyces spectabilis]KAI8394151.1 hypothetical protein BYT42DRAFT_32782 [Radiomyces spectabilis]
MGVRMTDLFYVTDLLDNRNMAAVTWTILSLAKLLASKDLAVEHSSKHNPWLHHNHKPCDSPKQPSPSFLTERTHRMWEQQEADVPLAQTWGSHTRHFTSPSHQSATYDFCTANTIVTSPSHNTSPFTKKQSRSVSLPLLSSDNDYQGFHGTGDWTIGEHFNEKETLLKEESLAGNAASNHPSMHLESVPTSFLSNDLYPPQPRYSIVSLPDEDDLLWEGDDLDAAVPQRTLPLGALSLERLSSQLTCDSTNIHLKSLSIEEEEISPRSNTSSGDSGYGTTRKHQQEPSSSMPLHLASLFDYRVNDQWENDHPHDVSGDMTGSHVEVSQRDRASNTYSYQEDHTHPTKTTSPASTTSASSRISKLAQLSFTKKLSMRHKMPFHMRYQEWTDQKVKREQQTSMQRQLSAGDISLIMQQPEEGDHIFDHVDYSKPSTIGFGHSAQYRLQT